MKVPETAPRLAEILAKLGDESHARVFTTFVPDDYRHWDELKFRAPPEGMSREE